MDEFNTIQESRVFDKEIFNALQDFCDDREGNGKDAFLAISPATLKVNVDNHFFIPLDWRTHEIEPLLRGIEPFVYVINTGNETPVFLTTESFEDIKIKLFQFYNAA
jgi:hypothetical protein